MQLLRIGALTTPFASVPQNNDLLWEDYEEKLADQAIRTMENYVAQFGEIKVLTGFTQSGMGYEWPI